MVRYQRLQFYRGSFSMKIVGARVQDTTGSNFIGVRYGKIPKVAILSGFLFYENGGCKGSGYHRFQYLTSIKLEPVVS